MLNLRKSLRKPPISLTLPDRVGCDNFNWIHRSEQGIVDDKKFVKTGILYFCRVGAKRSHTGKLLNRRNRNSGLTTIQMGIIHSMFFAVRVAILGLAVGFTTPVLQAQNQIQPQTAIQDAPFDINNDPRIDRREHPNAPHMLPAPSLLDLEFQNSATIKDDPVLLSFAAWIQKYRLSSDNTKPLLTVEGIELAKKRRAILADLITSNPKRALDWAISPKDRSILPPDIVNLLESRVTGCADYSVLITYSPRSNTSLPNSKERNRNLQGSMADAITNTKSNTAITRRANVNQAKLYRAYVYGWRGGLTTKYNIPIQGIAIDDLLAIDKYPARLLEAEEKVPEGARIGNPDKKCPYCGIDFDPKTGVVAQLGNTFYFFDSHEHFKNVMEELVREELVIGPKEGSLCDEPLSELIERMKQEGQPKLGSGEGNNGIPAGGF